MGNLRALVLAVTALMIPSTFASVPSPRALKALPDEAARAFDLGPIAARDETVNGEQRLRAAGPFFERQQHPEGRRFLALRPFVADIADPADDRTVREVLWPLGSFRTWKGQSSWRFGLAYGQDFDLTEEDSRYRFVVFPVWFQGRDTEGESYFAIFPLGGRIHEYLGQDELRFVLWPLYGSARVNEFESHAILWPLIAWSEGPRSRAVRVFPFYGKSVRDDRSTRRFVLWPFWTSVDYEYPDETGGGFVLWPLVGHAETPDTKSWMFLPPFFRFSRGVDYHEVFSPWPFVQYLNSKERDRLYLWPLWGRKTTPSERTTFALWPLAWFHTFESKKEIRRVTRLVPLFQSERRTSKTPDAVTTSDPPPAPDELGRFWKLWPLMSYERDGAASRLRALDVWPTRGAAAFDRNLAPFFTLYSRTTAPEALDEEFLWGLYRRRHDGEAKRVSVFPFFTRRTDGADNTEWSALGGLLGRRRAGLQTTWKALYLLRFRTGGGEVDDPRAPAGGPLESNVP